MRRALVAALLAAAVGAGLGGLALSVAGSARGLDLPATRESALPLALLGVACAVLYAAVGVIVVRTQPSNAIGWIFLGSACALGVMTLAYGYADLAAYGDVGWPAAGWAAWLASWLLVPPAFLAPCFVAQLFPDGRPLPGPWRWVLWVSAGFAGLAVLGVTLDPGPITPYPTFDNPAAPSGTLGSVANGVNDTVSVGVLLPFLASLASLVVRFRRSRGVERAQMKWLAFAGSVLVVAFSLSAIWDPVVGDGLVSDVFFLSGVAALMFVPVAVAIAIGRYRLYDIDRVVSRTATYGVLTLILGGAYAGLVLAGQALSSRLVGGSNLAIAVSTLIVAALFLPLRGRVQKVVDRRFNRRRYDAQRTLEAFGARLREQVELPALQQDLQAVVAETMQPSHAAVWFRGDAAS